MHLAAATLTVVAGLTGLTISQGGNTPARAETLPATLTAEQQAAVADQAAADQADREAIQQFQIRAAKAETERKAALAAAAAAEAARQQETQQALADPRGVAARLAGERGWGADQFGCLDKLWTRESNWTHTADNPTSSAYGIPQALPGKKMASAGADWETNPATQIRWGLSYIEDVYGTPCQAWGHSESHNWY